MDVIQVPSTTRTSCVVDEKFVPKVGMIFKTLEEARKFYKHYSKLAGFSTKIRNTTWDGDKIKNQLIVCTREGRWKSKIFVTLKTNPSAGLNFLARIYTISKVIFNHSHPCCPDQAEMLKQHRELSMFMRRTIKTHKETGIRPSKTYQSFVAAADSHRELGFIEKDVRNYITKKVRNISKEDDAKEFGKYIGHPAELVPPPPPPDDPAHRRPENREVEAAQHPRKSVPGPSDPNGV
ncbi:hypothetical protein Ahy_A04g019403 [Arachis hypogaea]|uniref:Uncharacterized protein n=1 Tax=Arachis hypogaea TaxID=3818 RepID=A0A445DFV8_ARAHY|nr:hypothetical protein Ahy_A04g019403 [Arachis hypogaea]